MPFPSRGAPAPAAQPAPAPYAPAAPPAPSAPPAPPGPAAAPERQFYAHINGQSLLKSESECRGLPPTTQIMPQDQSSTWAPVSAIFPASAPAAGLGRSAFAPPAAARPAQTAAIGAPKGLFAGVPNAEVMRKGAYLNQGDYVAKLCSAEFKTGRQKNMVIMEVDVVASTFDNQKPDTADCNREGSRASIFIQMNDSFAGNIKEIVLAVSGFDQAGNPRDVHDTVTQEECEALLAPEQPYAGAHVYLEARQITTKGGNPYTRTQWWPMPMKPSATEAGKVEPDWDKLFAKVR